MPITLKDKMKELSPAQRKKVEARAAELIAEEMTLRELRHARKLTQVKMARTLGVTQDSVSRLEKRSRGAASPRLTTKLHPLRLRVCKIFQRQPGQARPQSRRSVRAEIGRAHV